MDERMLSDKQRGWLSHVEACELTGGSMKAYAEQHALDLQSFYLWKGRLKKLGIIDAGPERRSLDRLVGQFDPFNSAIDLMGLVPTPYRGQTPINGGLPLLNQIIVRLGKMSSAEKTAVG